MHLCKNYFYLIKLKKEYLAPIKRLLLNRNYAAGLLTNGKLQIHNFENSKTSI